MIWASVGKELPDMRQNEREIKFITMGDAVRTAGQLTFTARVQGVGWGSCRSFADWMRHVYWVGGRVRQIPSPYREGRQVLLLRRT